MFNLQRLPLPPFPIRRESLAVGALGVAVATALAAAGSLVDGGASVAATAWGALFGVSAASLLFVLLRRQNISRLKAAQAALEQQVAPSAILVDLTERAEQENALRQREQFLKAVTDNIPGMVGYWDADLRCRFANQVYSDWFRKSPDQMIGISLPDLFGPEKYEEHKQAFFDVLKGEHQTFGQYFHRYDGHRQFIWCHYIPDFDGGAVRGFYVLASDMTELKAAQISLEALNQSLEIRTREAEAATVAKSQFLANMSHEIRSPMNAILGMLKLLSSTELTVRQSDYADKACSATNSLLHLLNDILDFSRIEAEKIALETVSFGIGALVEEVTSSLHGSVGTRPVELSCSIDAKIPSFLRGDAYRLRQVLINLVSNAIKFTDRGSVTAKVRLLEAGLGWSDIEFSVQDTGIGIAPEHHGVIFEGFTQAEASTTRRHGGAGLGLTICQRLISLMGGRLEIESRPGVGSRFHFTLRLETATASDTMAQQGVQGRDIPALPTKRRMAGVRLLVVEDEQINQQVARELLSGEGAIVAVADTGVAGVGMTLAASPPFDVVLVDIQMPGMDGFEVARRIREAAPARAPPIIAMTASAMASDRADCLAAGMADHIAKPIDLDHVVDTILAHCRRPTPPDSGEIVGPGSGPYADLDGALHRLGGKTALFRGIAALFARESITRMGVLRARLHDGDWRAARVTLHSLRGMAGALGLTPFADLAAEMEEELSSTGKLSQPIAGQERLQALLSAGIEALEAGVAALGESAAAPSEPTVLAEANFDTALDRLDRLLIGSNMRALAAHAELGRAYGARLGDQRVPLANAMDQLDFRRARQALSSLRIPLP